MPVLSPRESFVRPSATARLETLRIVGNITQNQHTGPDTGERTQCPPRSSGRRAAPSASSTRPSSPGSFLPIECRTIGALAEAILTLRVRGAPPSASPPPTACASPPTSLPPRPPLPSCATSKRLPPSSELPGQPPSTSRGRSTACWRLPGLPRPRVYRPCARRSTPRPAPDVENASANALTALLLRDGMNVLTHCNAGPLAAGGIGSALGIIYTAHSQGKGLHVWVDETRPLLQGARLTAPSLPAGASLHAHRRQYGGISHGRRARGRCHHRRRPHRVQRRRRQQDRHLRPRRAGARPQHPVLHCRARLHVRPVAARRQAITIEERKAAEITHHGGVLLAPDGVAV